MYFHQVLHNARLLLIGPSLAVIPRRFGGSDPVSDVAVPLLQCQGIDMEVGLRSRIVSSLSTTKY